MIHVWNCAEKISMQTETNYEFHNFINTQDFPQVHDFFELSLVTSGTMQLTVNDSETRLVPNQLVFIRPGEVHDKRSTAECQYVNLAFPAATLEASFQYLGLEDEYRWLLNHTGTILVQMTEAESADFQNQLHRLSLISEKKAHLIRAEMRHILLDCICRWFIPLAHESETPAMPGWLQEVLTEFDNPENMREGISYLIRRSEKTQEHLCRTFQKYLGTSPINYVTKKRLDYAANLITHTDLSLLDISLESGFQSESAFYHNFTKYFLVPPGKFRSAYKKKPECPAEEKKHD